MPTEAFWGLAGLGIFVFCFVVSMALLIYAINKFC